MEPARINYPLLNEKCEILPSFIFKFKMVSKTFRGGGSHLYFVICLEVYGGFVLVLILEFGLVLGAFS